MGGTLGEYTSIWKADGRKRDDPAAPHQWGQVLVLGGAARAIDEAIVGMDEGRNAQCPAVLFGDEPKAFERVSLI